MSLHTPENPRSSPVLSMLLKNDINGCKRGGSPPGESVFQNLKCADDAETSTGQANRGPSNIPAFTDPLNNTRAILCANPGHCGGGLSTHCQLFAVAPDSFEHVHRAKRARVENIIRGMSGSPGRQMENAGNSDFNGNASPPWGSEPLKFGMLQQGVTTWCQSSSVDELGYEDMQALRENKRKQRIPQQQHNNMAGVACRKTSDRRSQRAEERRQLQMQLEELQLQLRQLQERLRRAYSGPGTSRSGSEAEESDDAFEDEDTECCLRKEHLGNGIRDGMTAWLCQRQSEDFADMLKRSLQGSLAQVVDAVVEVFVGKKPVCNNSASTSKSPSNLQKYGSACGTSSSTLPASSSEQHSRKFTSEPNKSGQQPTLKHSPPSDQTEALPLVVRKPSPDQPHLLPLGQCLDSHVLPMVPTPLPMTYHAPKGNQKSRMFQGSTFTALDIKPAQCRATTFRYAGGTSDTVQSASRDLLNRYHGEASGHRGHSASNCLASSPASIGFMSDKHPFVKGENFQRGEIPDMLPNANTALQEGLTPNHLKKAKLMFFYTRYPSSNALKLHFSDVKFNRCITSQLIKWFSNFREFYYIQMEKFARQALGDGTMRSQDVTVTRTSELFRTLCIHFNKANDFEVPDRFLEVGEITLREFFLALQAGKDVDPSWKKAIYKVICKLDDDLPEVFRFPGCPRGYHSD
uniref:prospero homeobox protein 1-like n=1 Tax=Myxine glutinosa TaxID=7769 RepID=UPI00358E3CE7